MPVQYDLFFDGALKSNVASFGFILKKEGKLIDLGWGIAEEGRHLTEIVGEYHGLACGLDSFIRHIDCKNAVLNVYGDSAFVVGQVNGVGKPNKKYPELNIIQFKLNQIRQFAKVNVSWISRRENKTANDLAKKLRTLA